MTAGLRWRRTASLPAWIGAGAALVALSVLLRLPSFVDAALDRDEGAYAFVAQQWAQGATLYRDYFDHKPPLVYVAYRAALAAGPHLANVRLLFAIANGLTAWVCAGIVWRLCGRCRWLPALVTGLAACVFLNAPLLSGETANAETLMVLGTAGAAWWISRGGEDGAAMRAGLAGVCAGLACLAKPVALCEAGFFAAWLGTRGRSRMASLAAFIAGLALPPVVWLLAAYVHGTLSASIDAVFLYNLRYAGGAIPLWARVVGIPIDYGVPLALLWAGLGGCTLTALRRRPQAANFALAWSAAALVGVLAGGRVYGHYYQQLVPPLAVALGITTTAIMEQGPTRAALAAGALALGLGLWPPLASVWRFVQYGIPDSGPGWQPHLAAVVHELSEPNDTLLVWGGEPYLYFAAGRKPPTRFVYKYPLLGDSSAAAAARRELITAIDNEPLAVLITVKQDTSPETPRASNEEATDPQSPFHRLTEGLNPVLDTADFTLYARPDRSTRPWRERWERDASR